MSHVRQVNIWMRVLVAGGLLAGWAAQAHAAPLKLTFACQADNDLYRVMTSDGVAYPRYDRPAEAISAAAEGSGVLILADGYPKQPTAIDPALLETAAEKKLRVYLEYPAALPGLTFDKPRGTKWERAVVASDFFGGDLKPMRILAINALQFLPVAVDKPHIVAARVAGFDTAPYGLPEKTFPLLFTYRDNVLVATTKLSHFLTARYAPQDAWQTVWTSMLAWLCPNEKVARLTWTPLVRPAYGRDEPLPAGYEAQAFRRGVEWFLKSNLLWPTGGPESDGSQGIGEAPLSTIKLDGSQTMSRARRGDCNGESAMALAFGGKLLDNSRYATIAKNLLDFYYYTSTACKNERGDPKNGAYGLIAWGIDSQAAYVANYGDDNARLLLGTLATAALTGDDRWDEPVLRCLLANLRTTGRLGFRGPRIDIPDLTKRGWEHYFKRTFTYYSPHMEAYPLACYLWAYQQTGDTLFYDRAETALGMLMNEYTDGWRWMNGLAQERARILLPLAWLVRVKDTPEHRAWLLKAVDGLLALQAPCGAIREELGKAQGAIYPAPKTNEAYGTTEAPLIQENGDPVSDMLYTTNFAFLGLHEAAAATGDPRIRKAEDKLAEFLCRIQVRSEAQPSLDGGWFRAFDYERWEAWGSNADAGWGAWAIESGWTQAWITSVLAMREMNTSLWDLTKNSQIERHFPKQREEMLPEAVVKSLEASGLAHAAAGKPIRLITEMSKGLRGGSVAALVDGGLSEVSYREPGWIGLEGKDLEVVIDLRAPMEIRRLGIHCLQEVKVGIFLPKEVEFAVSDDGEQYTVLKTVSPTTDPREPGPLAATLSADDLEAKGRYVRVRAATLGTIPDWHHSAGRPTWLFTDEILVNPK
jgi:hypothetical protein